MATGGDGTEQQRQNERDREASIKKRFLALASGLSPQQDQEQREEETGVEEEEGGGGSEGDGGAGGKVGLDQTSGVDELRERFRRVFEGRYVAGDSTMAVMGGSEIDIEGDITEEDYEPDISVCLLSNYPWAFSIILKTCHCRN